MGPRQVICAAIPHIGQNKIICTNYDVTLPSPRIPRPPARTVGTIEVPAIAPVKIRAAPVVTIGNTTENDAFLNIRHYIMP